MWRLDRHQRKFLGEVAVSDGTTVVDDSYFYEALLEMCASSSLSELMSVAFRWIERVVPADEVLLTVHDAASHSLQMVAFANATRTELLLDAPALVQLAPEASIQLLDNSAPSVSRRQEPGRAPTARDPTPLPAALGSSLLVVRLRFPSQSVGALVIRAMGRNRHTAEHERLCAAFERPLALAIGRAIEDHEAIAASARIRAVNAELSRRLTQASSSAEMVGATGGLAGVFAILRAAATTLRPVILIGEVGVGKEALAVTLHTMSANRLSPFVRVNCATADARSSESALFGHENGGPMGESSPRVGALELAKGGTLYLDQVEQLPQALLERVLSCLRAGAPAHHGAAPPESAATRLVASSRSTLEELIETGVLLSSAWQGLHPVPIRVPPLRERREDVPMLVQHFATEAARQLGRTPPVIDPTELERLKRLDWPGNLLELRAVAESTGLKAGLAAQSTTEGIDDYVSPLAAGPDSRGSRTEDWTAKAPHHEEEGASGAGSSGRTPTPQPGRPTVDTSSSSDVIVPLERAMARHIERALASCNGRIEGPGGAAALVGLNPSTLRHRMRKLGIPFGRRR